MSVRTVLVCEAQVPFVHGGAEIHVRELVRELRERGYLAELVSVPFKWYPKEEILPHAAAWRERIMAMPGFALPYDLIPRKDSEFG